MTQHSKETQVMVSTTLPLYLLGLFTINVCVVVDAAEIDAFYRDFATLSVELDPRDYVVPPVSYRSNKYISVHENMIIGEINIFFFKHMLTTPVSLSLTFSRAPDFQATFTINAETAKLTIDGKDDNSVNYVRKDGKMMRFYVCFLGKLCPRNNVSLPYPMDRFKIEAADSHSLLRIFIKSFELNISDSIIRINDSSAGNIVKINMNTADEILGESICQFVLQSDVNRLKIEFVKSQFLKQETDHIIIQAPRYLQIKLLSLRFAIIMVLSDIDKEEGFKYKVFTTSELVTDRLTFTIKSMNKDDQPEVVSIIDDDDDGYYNYEDFDDVPTFNYKCF